MKILEKIDSFIEKVNEKKNNKFFKIGDLNELDLESGFKERIVEASKDKDYDKFFNMMLKKYKVKSYKDLPKNKQKAFFNEIDKKWKAKKETD